tara:strand:- start:535 stop:1119 length:585 start_codon:yes stop_codon:yes gene_type:complete
MYDKMKVKYNEGSMLTTPEMELEDTYSNIPEDEVEAAEASQLPDDEMVDTFQDFVLGEALTEEEQDMLSEVLESNEALAAVFDKVLDVAAEFSGEGSVEGIGTGVSDSIPARLSDGEFVFTKKAVDSIGAENLQLMMDEAEQAFDEGGRVPKAFGGLTEDPLQNEKTYGVTEVDDTNRDIKKQMMSANRMPSLL